MAGTGKSTIARTIAQRLDEQGLLGASFFFSRGRGDLGRVDRFFSTLARQLAERSNSLKQQICKVIAEQSDITQQSLKNQWKKLILQPIKECNEHSKPLILQPIKEYNEHSKPLVLIVDALDECDYKEHIELLIKLLGQLQTLSSNRLRIFITSRPETNISSGFQTISQATERFILNRDIADYITKDDLHIFFRHEFEYIRQKFRYLPNSWPGEDTIDSLIEKAECLFIFAATVCRFIKGTEWDPQRRLDQILHPRIILDADAGTSSDDDISVKEAFTKGLDDIYFEILKSSVLEDTKEPSRNVKSKRFKNILGPIVVLYDRFTIHDLSQLLSIEKHKIHGILSSLQSVIDVPEDEEDMIQLLHESFRDFLLDTNRCTSSALQINGMQAHAGMLRNCLKVLRDNLQRNICNKTYPGVGPKEVANETLDSSIPRYLRYACQFWVQHLEQLDPDERRNVGFRDWGEIYVFLREHILHWLEALGWIGKISEGVHMITTLKRLIAVSVCILDTQPQLTLSG